jgi:molecular chaperone GrpE
LRTAETDLLKETERRIRTDGPLKSERKAPERVILNKEKDFSVGNDMKDFYENEADEVIRKACEAAEDAEAEKTAAEPETDDGACAAEPETGAEETAAEPESEAEAAAKAAAAAAAAEEAAEKKEDGKKEKKDPKDQQIEDLKDQVRRNLAEFDNYRKRTDREKAAMFDMGAKNVLEKLLPVIDNFERGLDNVPDDPEAKAFADGMEMIYRQLLKNLEGAGVTPMDCLGKPFDPNYHNAVMHVEDETAGENTIVEVFQKGYMYRDTVLRFSMVKVAN